MAGTLKYFKAKGKEGDVIGPWEAASVFCSLSEERLCAVKVREEQSRQQVALVTSVAPAQRSTGKRECSPAQHSEGRTGNVCTHGWLTHPRWPGTARTPCASGQAQCTARPSPRRPISATHKLLTVSHRASHWRLREYQLAATLPLYQPRISCRLADQDTSFLLTVMRS